MRTLFYNYFQLEREGVLIWDLLRYLIFCKDNVEVNFFFVS